MARSEETEVDSATSLRDKYRVVLRIEAAVTSLVRLRGFGEWEGAVVQIGDLAWAQEERPEGGKDEFGTESCERWKESECRGNSMRYRRPRKHMGRCIRASDPRVPFY